MTKEQLAFLILCFVCFVIFAVFAVIAMMGGFKFLDQSTLDPSDPKYTSGQCCVECVESFGKFFSFVFLVPLGIFVLGLVVSFMAFGIENMKKAGTETYRSASSRMSSATKSDKEFVASEYLYAFGFFVFALLAVVLTFTSGKGLYSTTDYKNNTPTPDPGNCTQKWCVACKPEFWRLFLASAGGGLGVWIAATGLLYASKKHQQPSSEENPVYF